MRTKRMGTSVSSIAAALLGGGLCLMLLIRADAVRKGVDDGLRACVQIIIPSLYLFMAVSGFLSLSEAGEALARPLAPLTRRLFRLPACMGTTILLSCIGGYPIGARMIAGQLDNGKITREQAQRALCFCCNAGPSFVVTAIGTRLLGSAAAGGVLLAAHLGAALLLGILLSRRAPRPGKEHAGLSALPPAEAFVAGVNNATSGILGICSFVVFFSAFGALLDACGATRLLGGEVGRVVLIGLLEVTSGCLSAAALPGKLPLLLIPLFVSFAGCSILFQVRSMLSGRGLRFGLFVLCRAVHAALTLAFAYPFLSRLCPAVRTFASTAPPVGYRTPNTPATTVLLLLVCGFVLLCAGEPNKE